MIKFVMSYHAAHKSMQIDMIKSLCTDGLRDTGCA